MIRNTLNYKKSTQPFKDCLVVFFWGGERNMAIVVGIGGIIGALLRYLVGLSFPPSHPGAFPLATFIINMIGSFVLSWLTAKMAHSSHVPQWVVTGIGTGIIGAFTTFSTFSVETTHLFLGSYYLMAVFYLLTSFFGGWLMSFLGYHLGRSRKVGVA